MVHEPTALAFVRLARAVKVGVQLRWVILLFLLILLSRIGKRLHNIHCPF
jgi:hypothetical protein